MTRAEPWAPFLADPAAAAVLTDFDGTLAPIVDDPAMARPLPGAGAVLGRLAGRFGLVGVVSGRPVAFLDALLPPAVVLSGLYGLEVRRDGQRVEVAEAARWRPIIAAAVAAAASGPDGMRVEDKALSLTLHYRGRPGLEDEVRAFAHGQAAATGLVVRDARMSVELHPPIEVDKGTALRDLTRGFGAVCFIGDDRGDLPAFDALDDLAAAGVATLRVGVHSEEAPEELLGRADLVVDGPAAALGLLERLELG